MQDEEDLLRSVAMLNAQSILLARQRAEDELIRAKEELEAKTVELANTLSMMRATLESTTDGIIVTNQSGRVTDFNEKFVHMWNIPRDLMDSLDHQKLREAISKRFKNPDGFLARINEIYSSSPPETFDLLELENGQVFERFSKTQLVDGRTVGRVWSFRDISERVRVEEAFRDETRILELLNKTGITLSSTLDLQALLQIITDAATELSGAKFGAFFFTARGEDGNVYMLYTLSGAPRSAFEKLGDPRPTPIFAPTFRGEGPIRIDDVGEDPRYGQWGPHHGMPAGHLPVRSYLAVPVISRSGEAIGGLFFGHPEKGIFTDRTERIIMSVAAQASVAIDNARLYESAQKAAEERKRLLDSERAARTEAERANSMKDEFLAILSHELRTPLTAILGWAQVLKGGPRAGLDFDKGLATIQRNAHMQTQLIEDLLDMSRITSGKLRLNIQSVDPVRFIEAAIETVRPASEAKGIRLETILDPAAGPLSGDPDRFQQIVWNLLSNAIKFTSRNGKVQVLLERVNSHIEITVADTGIGIKPEFLPHVFDRFRQADATTSRAQGGLGLGLAIVKNLVELHGGTVQVASPGEGQGATFTVKLPFTVVHRKEDDAELLHPKGPGSSLGFEYPDLSGVAVLVVDDEPDARELIQRVLEGCRATVITASSAVDALQILEKEKPDVLISDIGMPNIDGYELLRRVRALGKDGSAKIPAIALTAFARSEDRTRALRAGFLVHVAKPVEPSELAATVASVCGRT